MNTEDQIEKTLDEVMSKYAIKKDNLQTVISYLIFKELRSIKIALIQLKPNDTIGVQ